MLPFMVEYVRNIEEEKLRAMRADLAEMEACKLKLQSASQPGVWVDETPATIRRLKTSIAEYEKIVEKLKAGETP
jgi:hypothetical protein